MFDIQIRVTVELFSRCPINIDCVINFKVSRNNII